MKTNNAILRFAVLFAVVSLMGWAVACGDINIDSNTVQAQGAFVGSGDAGDLTWTNFAEGFVTDYCVRCHGNPPTESAPFALVTYDDVSSRAEQCASQVASGGMPPSDPFPTQDESDSFIQWATGGTPE